MPRVLTRGRVSTLSLGGFDGGLNLRDAPTEVSSNETPDCMNVTLNERGGFEARRGILKLNPTTLLPFPPVALYYSSVADALLAYVQTGGVGNGRIWKSTDAGVTWSLLPELYTGGGEAAFIDFKDRVVFVNTLDGVYSYPSTLAPPTHTVGGAANMEEVRGSAIAVWQNKLWVTGDIREDSTHSRARVWSSNIGTELLWTVSTGFVDLRDVDTKPCTAIGAGAGMDVTGKPSLLVYKETSTYRINDSASGAYTTLAAKGAGAASAAAVASSDGRICSINRDGIWVTDGLAIPVRVSDRLQPLFTAEGLNLGGGARWTAGPHPEGIIFSVTRAGAVDNDLVLHYHPEVGWIVPHELEIGPMAVYSKQTAKLIGASSTGGRVFELLRGGTDDGTAIVSRFQTPWTAVADGDEARLRQLRAYGRGGEPVTLLPPGAASTIGLGGVDTEVRLDFATHGESVDLIFDQGTGFIWGTGAWDVGAWGAPAIESNADTPLDQVCKHVSFVFSATTSTSASKQPLLGNGTAPEVGAWAVYGVKLDHIQLGT